MKALKMMLAAVAFAGATAQAATNKEIINHVSYNVILATYNDLATKTAELSAAVDALAANTNQENLDKAQAAWRAARIPWESSESFLFGPVD